MFWRLPLASHIPLYLPGYGQKEQKKKPAGAVSFGLFVIIILFRPGAFLPRNDDLLLDRYCFRGTVTGIVADTIIKLISPYLNVIGLALFHAAEGSRSRILSLDCDDTRITHILFQSSSLMGPRNYLSAVFMRSCDWSFSVRFSTLPDSLHTFSTAPYTFFRYNMHLRTFIRFYRVCSLTEQAIKDTIKEIKFPVWVFRITFLPPYDHQEILFPVYPFYSQRPCKCSIQNL